MSVLRADQDQRCRLWLCNVFLTSSHLLTALSDLPAADGGQSHQQSQQTHGQSHGQPQRQRRKHQTLSCRPQTDRQTSSNTASQHHRLVCRRRSSTAHTLLYAYHDIYLFINPVSDTINITDFNNNQISQLDGYCNVCG